MLLSNTPDKSRGLSQPIIVDEIHIEKSIPAKTFLENSSVLKHATDWIWCQRVKSSIDFLRKDSFQLRLTGWFNTNQLWNECESSKTEHVPSDSETVRC